MASKGKAEFLIWHEKNKDKEFDFQKEMLEYCRSDVDIMRRICSMFREEMIKISGVDPFCYITIASCCMAVYRSRHLQANTIAMVPVNGYINNTNYSSDAIRWLDFVAADQGITIEHALNGSGEIKIGGVSVDGFCRQTNTIYQFHGCFYHGCADCYEGDTIHPLKKLPMATLLAKTKGTTDKFRASGYEVIELWEHRFKSMMKENKDLRVSKYCKYPVGHPEIITSNFQDVSIYFGIVKCKVVPPRGLFLPVLPYRCNGKLMFPLCRTCVESLSQLRCHHEDEERSLIGTWVTEEVKLAVDKGYRVEKIYEVYHFNESSDKLFRSYIDLFLKIKQESSGWPRDCNSEEERERYLKDYEEIEGILLDPEKIKMNPGLRQISK
nr:uncharacterized protein LOC107437164 [Parasteatoda tepidariorum]